MSEAIKRRLQRAIAHQFGESPDVFESVMLDMVDAHHFRGAASPEELAERARVTVPIAALFIRYEDAGVAEDREAEAGRVEWEYYERLRGEG